MDERSNERLRNDGSGRITAPPVPNNTPSPLYPDPLSAPATGEPQTPKVSTPPCGDRWRTWCGTMIQEQLPTRWRIYCFLCPPTITMRLGTCLHFSL